LGGSGMNRTFKLDSPKRSVRILIVGISTVLHGTAGAQASWQLPQSLHCTSIGAWA
jgi:hypothetical protein